MEIYIFGDQTADCRAFLQKVFLRRRNLLLTYFLERASMVLREEISRQSNRRRVRFPNFSTVQELVERYYNEGRPDPAIDSAIVCLSQLAHFIGYFEEQPLSYPQASSASLQHTRLMGLCTGLIAASTIASADSLTALLPLAVEAVRIAFRIGAHVGDVAERLEEWRNQQETWSTIVVADERLAEAALEKFHEENGIASTNQIWLSGVSVSSVTISGPPSVRRRLIERSDYFQKSHQVRVPVHGPYHARHLHSTADVAKVLTASTRQLYGRATLNFPVYSSVTGKKIDALEPFSLLEKCLEEILLEPLRWDKILSECISNVLFPSCKVHAMGPTNVASSLVSALRTSANVQVSMEDHIAWTSQQSATGTGKKSDSKIAIVGMSGRFPNAADNELFWGLLEKGLDVHRESSELGNVSYVFRSRKTASTLRTSTLRQSAKIPATPYGCFIENPGLFDARFFNMSPREATQTDPMQRLTLVTAYEAMEMAGIVPGRTPSTQPDRIGTFYGQTSDGWREINAAQDIDTYFISGGVRAFGPGRVNYFNKWSGPSFAVDTACSSSFAAIQLACTSLRAGDCDTAFTGGANVLTNPDIFSGLSRGHFLSKTGSCKTFDNDADGYCRGDGVATVILKRLDDAFLDKDPILGVIHAAATNHSAEAVSITHPHAGAQQFLFSKVLQESGVDAHDVSYVEMHGTGTEAGDGIEMQSVSSVFAPPHRRRRPDQPLYLGAVKANIGHGEAASGICAMIKVLLMLQKNTIPPHCGIKGTINKGFPKDLRERNVNIALEKTPFSRPAGGSRFVFLNNFSAAGGNTALLLEDGPEKKPGGTPDSRSTSVVTVSAKSLASFKNTVQRLKTYVDRNEDIDLPSLSYTSTARRLHHNYRAAFAVTDLAQVSAALAAMKDKPHDPISRVAPQVAFAFTGQGSQYSGLGKLLFKTSRQFRSDLEQFDHISRSQGFPSFMGLVDGSKDIQTLSPVAVQLGMTCVQIALVHLWASWGVHPSIVIGHSLGEYAALNAAGVLSIADTIYLVGKRATLLETDCTIGTHAMLAVKGPSSSIQDALSGRNAEIACVNGPTETVLSGTVFQIDAIAEDLIAQGTRCTKLNVPFAFHSSQVDPILKSFETLAGAATFHPPTIPIISPLLSEVVRNHGVFNPAYLSQHCRKTVDFLGGLTAGMLKGVLDKKTVWVEVGAHPVCSGMIRSTLSGLTAPSLRRDEDVWKTIANSMCTLYSAGVPLDWSAYHIGFESSLEVLNLPAYGFDEKVYWLDYTNDWCLTKGDTTRSVPTAVKPKFSTTSIHRIVSEETQENTATVVAESDLAHPLLHAAVSGHLVNGAGLCPSSIYADMAYTLANYAFKLVRPEGAPDMNVRSMENPAPLIIKNIRQPEHQLVQVEATADLASNRAEVIISSTKGKNKMIHGKCIVGFEDASQWISQWERTAFLVRDRIDSLKKKMDDGDAHRILRGMAYKLFASLVQYGDKFRGMKEVILDSANLEATSQVVFQAGPKDGEFYLSPYFIDSVAHISGFIVNATDSVDSKNQVYISHGWESMRFAKTLEADKKYHAYVKMQPGAGKMVAGDVYVFDDQDSVIGMVGGLKFQCIPRTLLNTFLPPADAAAFPALTRPKPQIQASTTTKKVVQTMEKKRIEVEATKKLESINGLTIKALNIVAKEIGVERSELADAIQFVDLGVDSLMSLTISGRFREELNLEVHSTLFVDFLTIGDLKKFLSQNDKDTAFEDPTDESDIENSTGATTPEMIDDSGLSSASKPSSVVGSPTESNEHEVVTLIRSTIADKMGITIEEIAETTDLSTIGMDSLMSLTILGSLREKTGLSFDSNLLLKNPSLEDIRKTLGLDAKATPPVQERPKVPKKPNKLVPSYPPATSILLQGNPRTATRKLFLFPDGSGSATSYVSIPNVDNNDLCVYGLNCPFMKDPTSYTCGIDAVSKIYLDEVLRRQPEGPYLLGGWSAGGVVAFEVTRQLAALSKANLEKNYTVDRLVLIDSPCPIRLEPLPSRLHHFFDNIGLLGTGQKGGTPGWLLPHFEYSIKNLSAYKPELMSLDFPSSKTFLIWARDGVCKNPGDPRPPPQADDPKSMNWLLNNRTDFGSNGWDKLLGAENCSCVSIGGNHFTMMKEPIANELGRLIKRGLEG